MQLIQMRINNIIHPPSGPLWCFAFVSKDFEPSLWCNTFAEETLGLLGYKQIFSSSNFRLHRYPPGRIVAHILGATSTFQYTP